MSHLIIKPFDTVYAPAGEFSDTWHNLETKLPGAIAPDGGNIPNVFCPVISAGFKPDFDAEISDAPADLVAELGENPISDWKILLADQRSIGNGVFPLHVAKASYCVHQNKILFDAMISAAKTVLGENGFEIATVGTLGAFSQFFVSISIKGENSFSVAVGDDWTAFFNLISSHNSLVASQLMLAMLRIVCMNTVRASIEDAAQAGTNDIIRHTKNSLSLITPELFSRNLKTWMDEKGKFISLMSALKSTPMTLDGFRAFAAGVFTRGDSDCLSTISFNRIGEMESLFTKGKGNAGVSAYDALNAFTEYFTSGAGVGKANGKNAAKRVASANFGRGNEWKLEAIRILSTEESLVDCLARGEILYSDKLKTI